MWLSCSYLAGRRDICDLDMSSAVDIAFKIQCKHAISPLSILPSTQCKILNRKDIGTLTLNQYSLMIKTLL